MEKLIKSVYNFLVEPIQLSSFVILELGVRAVRLKQASGKWGVNAFEEFQKHQANGIALRVEAITTGLWEFFDQVLDSQFA